MTLTVLLPSVIPSGSGTDTLSSLAELGTVTMRVTEYQPEVPTLAATITEAASSTVTHVVTVTVLPGLTHLTGDDSVGE